MCTVHPGNARAESIGRRLTAAQIGRTQRATVSDAPGNAIGGTAAGAGNLISANGNAGIYLIGSGTTGNQVQGNKIGSDATGRVVEPVDVVAQFGRAIRNVAVALRAAGCGPEDTVKLTYYVTDVAAYKANLRAIGEGYREVFGRHYPATTLIEVRSLFDPDALVEIDAVAVRQT